MTDNKEEKFSFEIYKPEEKELKVLREWISELENNKFFPYHLIEDELAKPENSVAFIHGIMDDGKSFKHWNYVLKHYLEAGERTQVLFPQTDAMEEELSKFMIDLRDQCPKLWNECDIVSLNKNQFGLTYKTHVVAYINSIATLKKTSRDSKLKWIHIDEYNQHDTRVRNVYINKFDILLSRNMRGVNKVFMGNNVTTDHPLLHRYNIYVLPDGITHHPIEYKDREGKWQVSPFNVVVWNFKRTDDEIFEKYKDIPEFYELNMEDFGSHAFYNESRNDQRDFIIDLDKYLEEMEFKYLVQSRIGVLEIHKYYFGGNWHYYVRYDKKAEWKLGDRKDKGTKSYALTKDFEESGFNSNKDMNNYFYDLKGSKRHIFRYKNASVAKAFQEQLNRYI